jgi:hypothetical protein
MGSQLSIEAKVDRLIELLAASDASNAQAAVTAMLSLGYQAVPQLIKKIDDRRPMTLHVVALTNPSHNSFEGISYHGVIQVTDCINLILTNITGIIQGVTNVSREVNGIKLPDSNPNETAEIEATRTEIIKKWTL